MTSITSRITFLLLFAVTAGQSLQASKECGNASLKGSFGEIGWGAVPSPVFANLGGPFVRVGQSILDGNGNIVSHTAASFNGLIFAVDAYSGIYIVHPDCTVEFHMQIPIPAPGGSFVLPTDLIGVVSDDGNEVANVVVSPPGLSIRILFHKLNKKQEDRNHCSNNDFAGGFGLDMFGDVVSQPPNVSGTFSRTGRLVFDGNGGFTAHSNASYGGVIVPETFAGTYSIDAGCKIIMHYTLAGKTFTWFGGLASKGNAATLMVTDPPGAAVVGTVTQQ